MRHGFRATLVSLSTDQGPAVLGSRGWSGRDHRSRLRRGRLGDRWRRQADGRGGGRQFARQLVAAICVERFQAGGDAQAQLAASKLLEDYGRSSFREGRLGGDAGQEHREQGGDVAVRRPVGGSLGEVRGEAGLGEVRGEAGRHSQARNSESIGPLPSGMPLRSLAQPSRRAGQRARAEGHETVRRTHVDVEQVGVKAPKRPVNGSAAAEARRCRVRPRLGHAIICRRLIQIASPDQRDGKVEDTRKPSAAAAASTSALSPHPTFNKERS